MEGRAEELCDTKPTEGGARLADVLAKITEPDNGGKVYLSLALTSELIRIVNTISRLIGEQKLKSDAASQTNLHLDNTARDIRDLEKDLGAARTRSTSRPIEETLEAARASLTATRKRHDGLDEERKVVERSLVAQRENLEGILQLAFEEVNQMKTVKSVSSSNHGNREPAHSSSNHENREPAYPSSNHGNREPAHSLRGRVNEPALPPENMDPPPLTENRDDYNAHLMQGPTPRPLSPRTQQLYDIQENLEHYSSAYYNAEVRFENRKTVEEENLTQRKRHIAQGVQRESRTEFDLMHVEQEMKLTRYLITVTEQFERMKHFARPYGIFTPSERFERGINEWEAPGYYKEPSEESQEDETPDEDPEMNARIERWQQGTGTSGFDSDSQTRMDVDLDEWDAETVRISESGSMIDDSRRAKIDEWREMCGLHDGH